MRWKSGVRETKVRAMSDTGEHSIQPKNDQKIEAVRDAQSSIRGIIRDHSVQLWSCPMHTECSAGTERGVCFAGHTDYGAAIDLKAL